MESAAKGWKVRDKSALLQALMEKLAGDAYVSFEGDLRGLRLLNIPGASEEPTPTLKRNTLWPKQGFTVVPLKPFMSQTILAAIGGTVPRKILHVQIERNGRLEFGAYDNFHPECIYFGSAIEQAFLEALVSKGIVRAYTRRPSARAPKR